MMFDMNSIIRKIAEEIRPSEQERRRLMDIYEHVKSTLETCLSLSLDRDVEVTLQGSLAKDTFLRGQSDIDVFLLFQPRSDTDYRWFKEVLVPVVINCFKDYRYTLNYASHPYVTLYVDDAEVNIVPAFRIESPSKIISAVDRTPFHTEYVRSHLSIEQRDEVRVLKYFLKQWGLYGAEASTRGFSGYLAELLVIAYGTFLTLLKNCTSWRAYETCIDIENQYKSKRECLEKFRNDVLVVVDPVDPGRNAASALSVKSFALFKLLAGLFIERPSPMFFRINEIEIHSNVPTEEVVRMHVEEYGSCLYGLEFDIVKPIPDVVWGQLNRLRKAVTNTLRSQGIGEVVRADSWIDRALTKAITVVEIIYCNKRYTLHRGPYAYDVHNALRFLIKNKSIGMGPWINDDGRLYTFRMIDTNIVKIIMDTILRCSPTSLRLTKVLDLGNRETLQTVDPGFKEWLRSFLEGDPIKKIMKLLEDSYLDP
ncbi:MAG: CCA tRNA nucleotidyltransferase [Ignisphaera sp.]